MRSAVTSHTACKKNDLARPIGLFRVLHPETIAA
jgi:hypothetical protein